MSEQLAESSVARKPERALALVKTNIVHLRRKARNTRVIALLFVPFVFFSIFGAVLSFFEFLRFSRLFNEVMWSELLNVEGWVALCLVLGWFFRWFMRRSSNFERQSTQLVNHLILAPGIPSNVSKLPASTSSKDIVRRVWQMRLRRMCNAVLIFFDFVLLFFGVLFLFVYMTMIGTAEAMESSSLQMLIVGVGFTPMSLIFGAILLKSGHRLIEEQESLVTVGVYLNDAEAQPGLLQIAEDLQESGQLSVHQSAGALSQSNEDESSAEVAQDV